MGRIKFILRSSFDHIIHNPVLNLLSILTLSLAYLIFNTSLLIYSNLEDAVKRWEKSFVIVAYINKNAKEEEIKKGMEEIRNLGVIRNIDYVSDEEALRRFREQLGSDAFLLEGIDSNPLPGYFVLTPAIAGEEEIEKLINALHKIEVIEDVQYEKGVILKFLKALSTLKLLSFVLNLFILITVIFIVSNTIRLSLFARKDEIEIMKLVGASDAFVGAPYVIESLWQNILSILISIGFLYLLYTSLFQPISDSLSFLFGIQGFTFLKNNVIILVILLALMLGFSGSFISLRRYLRV